MYLLALLLLFNYGVRNRVSKQAMNRTVKSKPSLFLGLLVACSLCATASLTHAQSYTADINFESYTQTGALFTYKYTVQNITQTSPAIPNFWTIKVTFRHIESINNPTFPGPGLGEGQNPPGWIGSFVKVQDNPEVDVYDITFTSSNFQNYKILPPIYIEQFYFTVRGPLGETPVVTTLVDSLATAQARDDGPYPGYTDSMLVDVLDFDNSPPPLTPPILDNLSISGNQICFDISNMTIGALITVEGNTDITNPQGWTAADSWNATAPTTNWCEPINGSTVYRAKAQ